MATIKDVAEAAGVSIGTVDRILHNRGRFSVETAERVRRAVDELNYTPNIHARGLKNSKSYIFGAMIPNVQQDAGYWRLVTEGIKRAKSGLAPMCRDVNVFHFDRYSRESVDNVLEEALSSGLDGLLIAPVVPEVFQERLTDSRVPYLFIDTDIPGMAERISFIGQDSYRSGTLSGKLMAMLIGKQEDKASVLVVEPPGVDYHLQSRIRGFRDYMEKERPEAGIDCLKMHYDDEQRFHTALDEYFSANSLPAGFFAANSSVYYLASFLNKRGGGYPEIPVIGYDLIPGQEGLIRNGTIDFILTQDPEEQAYKGLITLYDSLVLKKTVNDEIIIPLNIITRENLHTFGQVVPGGDENE